MKKLCLVFSLVVVAICSLPLAAGAFDSFELKPFIKFGSQDMDEPGDKGSRSFIGIGLQIQKNFGPFDFWAGISGDAYWEAPDEKLSAPTQRLGFNIGARYNEFKVWKFSVSPFFSLGAHNWNRNIRPDPVDPSYVGRFEEIRFLSARGGVNLSLDWLFLEIGPTFPLWSDTDKDHSLSGKLGYAAFLGVSTKIADIGLFYDSIAFGGDYDGLNRQPDFRFSEIGLKAVFKF